MALNSYIVGAGFARLGNHAEALACLEHARKLYEEIGEQYMCAGVHAHRARLLWQRGEEAAASGETARFLALMRKNTQTYCCWLGLRSGFGGF